YTKVLKAYKVFEELIVFYGVRAMLGMIKDSSITNFDHFLQAMPAKTERHQWMNLGGQLMPESEVLVLRKKINTDKIKSWDEIHAYYETMGTKYPAQKTAHALAALSEHLGINLKKITPEQFNSLLGTVVSTKEWMAKGIYDSKAKDFVNPYRKMVYETTAEMNAVVGKLEDNSFIKEQVTELKRFKREISAIKKAFSK
ncbi:MAG TPA: DUF4954 family protein, partial [Sediminibacterium sp.]|nr:DUF4954 family protein [Sediminibacterium sp.]